MPSLAGNRVKMAKLIYKLESFTECELLEALKRETGGSTGIDELETPHEYLQGLYELGILTYQYPRYSIVPAK